MKHKNKNLKLWLDDERPAPFGWLHVLTASDAITTLATHRVSELSLDHDLGLIDETGYDVLLWIKRKITTSDFKPPVMYAHSVNPVERKRMLSAIKKIIETVRKRDG